MTVSLGIRFLDHIDRCNYFGKLKSFVSCLILGITAKGLLDIIGWNVFLLGVDQIGLKLQVGSISLFATNFASHLFLDKTDHLTI